MAEERIGKYVIQKKLGQGGMGIVYKCLDPETNRPAAVKVLPQQLASDPVFLQRFKREVMTLKRMDHPNIVKIYDHGMTDGAFYYAMEYVEGTSLEDIVGMKQKMPPLRALRIIRGCAEALQHSHSLGIIHRDIKPANIMLLGDDTVKVMDFGIAKVLDATRMTATQGVLGTAEYMSPEQSMGRHIDPRSDIYSLGAVLYQCLTTRLPITGTNPTAILMKLRSQRIEAPEEWVPELPRNVCELVMRMLEKEPEKRIESAQALIREIERVEKQLRAGNDTRETVTPSSRVIRAAAPPPTPFWRSQWIIALAAVVVTSAIWYYRNAETHPSAPVAPLSTSRAPDEETATSGGSMEAKWLVLMARRAREAGALDKAEDYCNVLRRHFPDTPQGAQSELELLRIQQARRRQKEKPAAMTDPQRAAAEELLVRVREARQLRQFGVAEDLCRLVQKHYPNTLAADEAEVELLQTQLDRKRSPSPAAPDTDTAAGAR